MKKFKGLYLPPEGDKCGGCGFTGMSGGLSWMETNGVPGLWCGSCKPDPELRKKELEIRLQLINSDKEYTMEEFNETVHRLTYETEK